MKKRVLTVILAVVLLFAFIPSLAACNTDADDPNTIRIKVWGSQEDMEMIDVLVSQFVDEYNENPENEKRLRVSLAVNGENGASKDAILADRSTAAEVFSIAHDQLGALVETGAIVQLPNAYATATAAVNSDSSMSAATYGGKVYGFPFAAETYFLYYNNEKLTATDVESMEGILAANVGAGTKNFAYDFGNAYYSAAFFFTEGVKLFGDSGEDKNDVTFADEGGVKAAKFLMNLDKSKTEALATDVAPAAMKNGSIASYVSGPWDANLYAENMGDKLGVVKLPTIGGKQMKSFAGFKLYVVKSQSDEVKSKISLDLAQHLTSAQSQLTRFQMRKHVPTATELATDPAIAAVPSSKALASQLPFAIPMPSIPEMSNFWDNAGTLFGAIYENKDNAYTDSNIQSKLEELVGKIKG